MDSQGTTSRDLTRQGVVYARQDAARQTGLGLMR
jgi:hypothetical protein